MWSLLVPLLLAIPTDVPEGFTPGVSARRSVLVDEEERPYRLYVPRSWSGPLPVVFVFHGEGGTMETVERYTRFNPLADERGFVIVYPQGAGKNWDYGPDGPVIRSRGFGALYSREGTSEETDERFDDVELVRTIVSELAEAGVIDASRVFATGISSGAMFCHRLVAEASDVVAGIAPVSGGMGNGVAGRFDPDHPVSFVALIGEDDPVMPVAGGPIAALLPQDRGQVEPADRTIAEYLKLNGITGEPTVAVLPDGPEEDETTTRVYRYPPGKGGVLVTIYRIEGAGHNWPGRELNYHVELVGRASQDFDGSVAILDFFERCPPRRSGARAGSGIGSAASGSRRR